MSGNKVFTRFMSGAWKVFKEKYSFMEKLKEPFCAAVPKSSSFYLGISPKYKKHVFVNFQASNKPWRVGELESLQLMFISLQSMSRLVILKYGRKIMMFFQMVTIGSQWHLGRINGGV
ncbi:hypothetical protein [Chitinivorax sp. B]|uniref:hypothetical protein n=1 Tax=Chitinivorax sp. B TaxID=2502235 RepID=UPI0010F732D2|nr:hypothetical protein [Chitinivorax sp. B]